MSGYILGEKSGTTQFFTTEGERIPVTFIKTSTCYILRIKTLIKDGYDAVQLGFGHIKNIKKPAQGELKQAGVKTPLHFFREFRLTHKSNAKTIEENKKFGVQINEVKLFPGDEVKPDVMFKIKDLVHVSGVSKGKGFQGVVRRHHFKGGPHTHGQSDRERAPGAIGSTTTPGRVYKGKRMAGRMGGERVTLRNLEVIDIKADGLAIKGLIPGARGSLMEVRV